MNTCYKKNSVINTKTGSSLIFVFALISVIATACKKAVTVPNPVSQLATAAVFNDNGSATAAQLYIYGSMLSQATPIHLVTGLSSDEFFSFQTAAPFPDFYANSLNINDGTGYANIWQFYYQYVYDENALLENLPKAANVNPKVRQQLLAEAKFTRAWFFFYLTNLYGDIPLVTTTDYTVNVALPRTPKLQVYQQIIADLKDAQANLSNKYVDGSDTTVTVDRGRPTSWAAAALLARVYLYAGDEANDMSYYQNAEASATTVINNSALYSLSPLSGSTSVFMANSSEAIWQLIPPVTVGYANDGGLFVMTVKPSTNLTGSTTISNQLLASFEVNDQRKTNWVGTFTDKTVTPNVNYYFPNKYKLGSTATVKPSAEYEMMLRLGEQYLIRAEARAQQGNFSGAVSDLNMIRNRAGLGPYNGALDKTSLLAAIAHENQVELFAEGHRWFNLKRTGQVDAVMSVVAPQKGGIAWQSFQQLYPIPLEAVQNSSNVRQNSGY